MNNGRAASAGMLSRTGIDDAEGFSAVFMKLTDGAAFVLLSFARKQVGAATVGEAPAGVGAGAPGLLYCVAPLCAGTRTGRLFGTSGFPSFVESFRLFALRVASISASMVAAIADGAWPLPIDADARCPMLVVIDAAARLSAEGFMVTEDVRVASVRLDGVGSIVGLVREEDSELPIAWIET
jgi:hypothetical protein